MSHYTFKEPCESCGAVPSYNGHMLCDVCVTGEKNLRNDWVWVLKAGGYVELPDQPLFLKENHED